MAAAAPEIMTWSFMKPREPGEHRSVTEAEDPSYGYIHNYDLDRMLANPDAAKITSWISGWSKYHGAVLVEHHNNTVAFRDLLQRNSRKRNSRSVTDECKKTIWPVDLT